MSDKQEEPREFRMSVSVGLRKLAKSADVEE